MKKILPLLNIVLIVSAILGSFYLVVTRDDKIGLILKDASILLTITAPYWIEKIFKKKLTPIVKFICILFVFCAHFLGATIEFYNEFAYYDKITHTISGILTALLAMLLLKQLDMYHENKIFFNILFIISVTLSVAVCWEFFEYFGNIFFGGDAQRVAKTGVNDTMQDMLVAFLGSIFVSILYYIEETKKLNGMVKSFMNGMK